jgi:hypothetical protein
MSPYISPYVLRGVVEIFNVRHDTFLFVMIIRVSLENGHKVRDLGVSRNVGRSAYDLQQFL